MTTDSNHGSTTAKQNLNNTTLRHQLADAAKRYQWSKVIALLDAHPDLINATRPDGSAHYTVLHQAANGNAPLTVIEQLITLGAQLNLRTAQQETALDIALRKGHQTIAQFLQQTLVTSKLSSARALPLNVSNAQSTCALRFQGYAYLNSLPSTGANEGLRPLVSSVVEILALHHSLCDNFAAFFGLQRYLHKWGGEQLEADSRERIAYDFLFLHLYTYEPPVPFRHTDYCQRWQTNYANQAEEIAAIVRRRFSRS